jgi:hypothetical protein
MRNILNKAPYKVPSTIEDLNVIEEIIDDLKNAKYL